MVTMQNGVFGAVAASSSLLEALEKLLSAPLPIVLALADLGRAEQGFLPFRPGIEICAIYGTQAEGPSAALLKYAPGATVPAHSTPAMSTFSFSPASSRTSAALTAWAPWSSIRGTRHQVTSAGGCVVLAIWERPVQHL